MTTQRETLERALASIKKVHDTVDIGNADPFEWYRTDGKIVHEALRSRQTRDAFLCRIASEGEQWAALEMVLTGILLAQTNDEEWVVFTALAVTMYGQGMLGEALILAKRALSQNPDYGLASLIKKVLELGMGSEEFIETFRMVATETDAKVD